MPKGAILIVDDTAENLEVVSQILEDAGYEVAMAINGDRALKLVDHYPPDLILLDVQMPVMDGFATCGHLKHNPVTADIPVIFMTALNDIDHKVKGFELGAVDYITKPFQEPELLARVNTHLQLRHWSKTLETRVQERTQELQQSQLQLVQHEKMSALGNLMAGVAHEINNPLGFLHNNLLPAQVYIQGLFALLDLYQAKYPGDDPDIEAKMMAIDLDFVRTDLPQLLTSMESGVQRIREISDGLRTFSRRDQDRQVAFQIQDGIESTLLLLKHRTKANAIRPAITIQKNYGEIPPVMCFPGQLNQVFMNILANAIDAFDENNCGKSYQEIEQNPNQITIQTSVVGESVQVEICDNGCGMTSETVARIFEQGFTTKTVGKGTGLGMAIAQQIIEEKHDGILTCTSELGKGTKFAIAIPISP